MQDAETKAVCGLCGFWAPDPEWMPTHKQGRGDCARHPKTRRVTDKTKACEDYQCTADWEHEMSDKPNNAPTPETDVIMDNVRVAVYADNDAQRFSHMGEARREIERIERERDDARDRIAGQSETFVGLAVAVRGLFAVLDAHEIDTFDCDRSGVAHCDCLEMARTKVEAMLATVARLLGKAGV